ncbi:hypothetical protein N0V91_011130 [Didymella pomorum]|uniref:Uncharacterized protein n=1 Tax=Didymella pomorum TaxID=749634 RepID=A0A9W9D0K6_9PLEO|nr:hypothetical protein N0V91_011130 [Didymella pomorum]
MLSRTLILFLSLVLPIIAAPLANVNHDLLALKRRNEAGLDVADANIAVRNTIIDANIESVEEKREAEEVKEAEEEGDITLEEASREDLAESTEGKRGVRPGSNIGGSKRGVRPGGNIGGHKRGVRPGGNVGGQKRGVRPGKNIGGSKRGVRPGGNIGGQKRGVRGGGNIGGQKRGVRPGKNIGGN